MPLLAAARGRQRRRLRGRRLRRGRPAARHHGRPRGARRRPARARHRAVRRPGAQPHRGRARVGAGGRGRRPGVPGLLPDLPRPHRARRATSGRCPRSSPTPRPAASPTSRGVGWVWTTFNELPVGPGLGQPRGLRARCSTRCSTWPTAASTCCGWTRRRSCGSARAPTARTSPRRTCSCRRCGRWSASRRPASRSRPRRSSRRDQLVQYLGAHDGYRPECDLAYNNQLMVLLWSSLATRDARLAARRARPDAAGPAGDRLGHLPALPRRHRLGRLRRGRARGRARPASRTARSSATSTPASTPARSPAARCSRPTRAPATAASPAAPRRCAGSRRRSPRRRRADRRRGRAAADALLASSTPTAASRCSTWATSSALRNDPRWADDPAHAGDNRWLHRPPMDWAAADRRADPAPWRPRCSPGWPRWPGSAAGQLALRAGDRAELLDTGDDRVLGYVRRHPRGARLVALAAFSDDAVAVPRHARPAGVRRRRPCRARRPRRPGRRAHRAPARVGLRLDRRDLRRRSQVRREPPPTAAVPSSGVRRVGWAP